MGLPITEINFSLPGFRAVGAGSDAWHCAFNAGKPTDARKCYLKCQVCINLVSTMYV